MFDILGINVWMWNYVMAWINWYLQFTMRFFGGF